MGEGEGRAYWPGSIKQDYFYRIDLKSTTNNVTDDTSKHTKFKVICYSTFRDMTSQKFPFQNGTSHCDSIFTPGIEQNSNKITFHAWKHLFWHKLYPPPLLCISMFFKQNKNSNSYVQFFETSHFKNNCRPIWWIDFAEILLKCVEILLKCV